MSTFETLTRQAATSPVSSWDGQRQKRFMLPSRSIEAQKCRLKFQAAVGQSCSAQTRNLYLGVVIFCLLQPSLCHLVSASVVSSCSDRDFASDNDCRCLTFFHCFRWVMRASILIRAMSEWEICSSNSRSCTSHARCFLGEGEILRE